MRQVYTVSDKTKAKYLASCPDQGDRLEPAREINFSAHANCGKMFAGRRPQATQSHI
jgi:hypothetical protein